MIITYAGKSHLVEMLGDGRQYLVAGVHPSGVHYGREGTELSEVDPESLTVITHAQTVAFFDALQTQLEAKGIECERLGSKHTKSELAKPQEDLFAPDLEVLRTVVEQIPNEIEDRDGYIMFGCAVKAAGAEDEGMAQEVFEDWALRWAGNDRNPGGNTLEMVRADWARMKPPFRVGYGWLLDQLVDPNDAAAEEFDTDPEALSPAPPSPVDREMLMATDAWARDRVLVALHDSIRYVPETGHWHVWNGYAWKHDTRNIVVGLVISELLMLSRQLLEMAASTSKKEGKPFRDAARKLQGKAIVQNVLWLLESDGRVTVNAEDFDSDPWLLNTPGGVVDLSKGTMTEPDPKAMLAKYTAVAPAAGDAPNWFAFLHTATGGDKALQRFVQKQVGYALTGDMSEQTLSFVWGQSMTGKTTFIEAIAGLFGTYAVEAAMDSFVSNRGGGHPTDLADRKSVV